MQKILSRINSLETVDFEAEKCSGPEAKSKLINSLLTTKYAKCLVNKLLKSILVLPWLQMGCWYDGIHDVTRGRRSAHNRRTQSLDEQNQEDAERQRYSRRTNACLPAPLTFKQSSFYWQVIALLLIYCIIFFSGQQATDSGNNLRIFQRKRCEFRKSSEWVNTLY